jgi:hypothetical protein
MSELYKTTMKRNLISERNPNKISFLIEATKKLSTLQQVLESLHTSVIEDRYKICQLALYFTQENFAGLRGSRLIFADAKNERDQSKRGICYTEFTAIIPFVPAVASSLLSNNTGAQQPVPSQRLFSPLPPSIPAEEKDEVSSAPLERKNTGKPGDFKR